MSLQLRLRSQLLALLVHRRVRRISRGWRELTRRLAGRPHTLKVFLELDDPYSYLLSLYLPELAASYDVRVELYLGSALTEGFRPRPDMLAIYAQQDCERVARELGVPFLDKGQAPPVEHRRALLEVVAQSDGSDNHSDDILTALSHYWRGDSEAAARMVEGSQITGRGAALLTRNQALLAKLGHYNCATVYYAGEWYWGVDRLHYLIDRLDTLGARHADASTSRLASIRQAMQVSLPVARPSTASDLPPLELFLSFRSPYSYLAVRPVYDIADAFGLDLIIRPVLPMVMRGLPVPRSKMLYIIRDTARAAERLGLPFGRFADPVGAGIERCMAVFMYARSEKRERDFVQNAFEGIWARSCDVVSDKGMRAVTGRTGLFWPDVKAAMENNEWRAEIEANRESMEDSGSWGVPTLRLGDFVVWGQDRTWLLARHIEELCDTGDGILV